MGPGSFYSTHRWGVATGHNSSGCHRKASGHISPATRSNPAGPGSAKNKGWDNFISTRPIRTASLDSRNNFSNISYCKTVSSTPSCSPTPHIPPAPFPTLKPITISDTDIVDRGASNIYLKPNAPIVDINPSTLTSFVGNASIQPHRSSATFNLSLTHLPVCNGNIMPTFKHNLVGFGRFCDHG